MKKEIPEKQFQKAKFDFALHWQVFTYKLHCIDNYLYTIYIVFNITNSLDMIEGIWEDAHRLYINAMHLYEGHKHPWILVYLDEGSPEVNSQSESKGWLYI